MVRVGYLCVAAAAGAEVCNAFVAPTGAARTGAIGSNAAPKLGLAAARGQSSTLQRAVGGTRRGRRQLGLQMQQDGKLTSAGGFNTAGEAPFEIRGFSLGNVAALTGLGITLASFYEYFSSGGSGGLSGIGFVYGIPIALIGLALKYAELEPAPLQTTAEAEALFEVKGTETMKSVKQDVTRHRYGDEAHLDTTVKFLGLVLPRKAYPQLQYLTQTVEPNGELGFSMVFQSLETPYNRWIEPERVNQYIKFFGPGVDAEVIKISSEEKMVAIKLTTLPPGVLPTLKEVAPPPVAEKKVAEGEEPAAEPAADA